MLGVLGTTTSNESEATLTRPSSSTKAPAGAEIVSIPGYIGAT